MNTSAAPRFTAFALAALVTLSVLAGLDALAGAESSQASLMARAKVTQPA